MGLELERPEYFLKLNGYVLNPEYHSYQKKYIQKSKHVQISIKPETRRFGIVVYGDNPEYTLLEIRGDWDCFLIINRYIMLVNEMFALNVNIIETIWQR